MWHKEDDEGDSYEKNDGGWKTSPHLLLPFHFACETVCGKDDGTGEVVRVVRGWSCSAPSRGRRWGTPRSSLCQSLRQSAIFLVKIKFLVAMETLEYNWNIYSF